MKTPTLFFAGESDTRVPMAQSVEMYRALKSHGVPTHLYVAPREGHDWGELRHLIFKANTELEWFEKYALRPDVRLREGAERAAGPAAPCSQSTARVNQPALTLREIFHKIEPHRRARTQ